MSFFRFLSMSICPFGSNTFSFQIVSWPCHMSLWDFWKNTIWNLNLQRRVADFFSYYSSTLRWISRCKSEVYPFFGVKIVSTVATMTTPLVSCNLCLFRFCRSTIQRRHSTRCCCKPWKMTRCNWRRFGRCDVIESYSYRSTCTHTSWWRGDLPLTTVLVARVSNFCEASEKMGGFFSIGTRSMLAPHALGDLKKDCWS